MRRTIGCIGLVVFLSSSLSVAQAQDREARAAARAAARMQKNEQQMHSLWQQRQQWQAQQRRQPAQEVATPSREEEKEIPWEELNAEAADPTLPEEQSPPKDDGFARLQIAMGVLVAEPCISELYFRNIGIFGDDWIITCPQCAAVPAKSIYPKAVLEQVERWAVNGKITVKELLQMTGECPTP